MTISQINIYPVKGMRGVSVDSSNVELRGLQHDRRYLVVDDADLFVTQRNDPVMATIIPSVVDGGLRFACEGKQEVYAQPTGDRRTVTVWRSEVEAVDCGDEIAAWLREIIGRPCRLVAMDSRSRREIDQEFGQPGEEVSFADGFPLLLANQASLADLNHRLSDPLPMNRFRPNVVIHSDQPWAEDAWQNIRIGDVTFRNVKPCARCLVTTTDQLTGERRGDEPLRTLAKFRNVDGKVMFGVNLIPNQSGAIRIGDPVTAFPA